MTPIHELLNKIRWDPVFGCGSFEIGFFDRVDDQIERIELSEMAFEEGNHFSFELLHPNGHMIQIPFHRIREVYKDGELIWERSG